MAEHYRQWHQSCRELAQHQQLSQERAARAELLEYQLKELNEFNPQPGNSSKSTKSTNAWPTAVICSQPAKMP
jgi:DNA repair ATPase RecN